ncbi:MULTISPECIES: hypothetical protein [unclassified Bradyrhizobium]|uniref:hypothetical protein n=1 Tax=unclassified Bradyrhizobium TaxID=2631580 RepID=UPI001BA68CCF|nr:MULTISPECIES: hypothetical protein [unclassified Bradyrhizobium]MBR1204051.1 hypothetical protein [Bradyrhizobium sp. AUGA SZCCT0124]MBR1310063.1 hypothetical protein [Bradyrhizobium sp. AUGA SZCCT0051]MBR1340204.1 hypothetical protein [Bradyrhizobium sp. AUGA SZCCT0105]MBR1354811.1 hypothetical protein [Bradyrhizobium sp. AUGA SZCCT0045]
MVLARWCPIVALTMLGTIGVAAIATADPIQPSKIRTIKIQEPNKPAADTPLVRTTPVRPAGGETRDASGREWPATNGVVDAASDPHRVRSLTIHSEQTYPDDRYRRFVPEAAEPSGAAPQ